MSEDDLDVLIIQALILRKDSFILNHILAKSTDKLECARLIQDNINILLGDGFALTGHSISRTLESRYTEVQKQEIFTHIRNICSKISSACNVDWFLTSGTLLGLIREGGVIKHDDDFDVAYVSSKSSQADVIAERKNILSCIRDISPEVTAKDCGGGHFWVYYNSKTLSFMFDLFTSWVDSGYFNEYPLKPNELLSDEVLPPAKMSIYNVEVNVPRRPEMLLELNYGAGWRVPDPSFRFNFSEYNSYYKFLLNNKIKD